MVNTVQVRRGARSGRAMRGVVLIALVGALAATAACGNRKKTDVLFDGQRFRAKAAPVDKSRTLADFVVTVNGVSASLDGAREAGRYQGTRYCIEKYGSSKIAWALGPDADPAQLRIENDRLSFRGTCQRP
ncbi:hypothetical protein SAMN05444007_102410 [Cribrihabitans marinus]|uniref:Lipoprotein n=2 Tax=Cribrihabitans marinus TaxID=1227549 RepID=A0A1H6TP30_9RHOB|nr:hypothetical protein SAMN05444007_102410 [Cribrihabitans marinus]